jgi:hypothetical protein
MGTEAMATAPPQAGWLRNLNAAAVWAGLTAFVWYAFGAVPLQIPRLSGLASGDPTGVTLRYGKQ